MGRRSLQFEGVVWVRWIGAFVRLAAVRIEGDVDGLQSKQEKANVVSFVWGRGVHSEMHQHSDLSPALLRNSHQNSARRLTLMCLRVCVCQLLVQLCVCVLNRSLLIYFEWTLFAIIMAD